MMGRGRAQEGSCGEEGAKAAKTMSSNHVVLADKKQQHHRNSSSSNNSSGASSGNNNNTNKPTNDLAQIEKIKRIVQREILGNGRHLFPDGRWPSDGVVEPAKHPEPYSAAMKFGGRDPNSKKRPGLTKRPPNMWMIFRMHAASVVMEDFPEVNQAALTSVLAPIWQSVITPEEKDLVREESERLKEFHKLQFPEWKYKPRQKKRASQQQQQQQQRQEVELDDEEPDDAPVAKRECHHSNNNRYAVRRPQQQQQVHPSTQQYRQHQQQQQQQQQHHHHQMPQSVSPYLSAESPDIDNIDGLQLPLSVETSPQAAAAAATAVSMSASCLPFGSAWNSQQQQQQQQSIPVSLSEAASYGAAPCSSGLPILSPPLHQHHQQHQQQQHLAPKDPALRSILASSAPSSVSSTVAGELSCLPDLLPCDYFSDFTALPDLEAYLSPEGCSGGLVAEPNPLPTQQQFDFPDLIEIRRSVKQEFRYAVI